MRNVPWHTRRAVLLGGAPHHPSRPEAQRPRCADEHHCSLPESPCFVRHGSDPAQTRHDPIRAGARYRRHEFRLPQRSASLVGRHDHRIVSGRSPLARDSAETRRNEPRARQQRCGSRRLRPLASESDGPRCRKRPDPTPHGKDFPLAISRRGRTTRPRGGSAQSQRDFP